jgi:hypothetical protein
MTIGSSNHQFNDPSFPAFQQNQPTDQIQVPTDSGKVSDSSETFSGPVTDKNEGKASDPTLELPTSTTPFTMDASSLIGSILSNLTQDSNTAKSVPNPNINDIPDLFGQGGGSVASTDSGLQMATPSALLSTDKTTVYNALVQYMGLNGNQSSSIASVLDQMATQIAAQNANGPIQQLASGDSSEISSYLTSLIPQNNSLTQQELATLHAGISDAATSITAKEYTSGLSSSNKDDVFNALESFTSIQDNTSLSDTQKTQFTDLLKTLSDTIASQNATGKPDPALTSFDSRAVTNYLSQQIDTSKLSEDNQQAFQGILDNAGSEISSLNAASGTLPAQDAIMTGLQSQTQADVLHSIDTMLAQQGMTQDKISSIEPQLDALAQTIAQKNSSPGGSGLDITDAASLQQVLIGLLGTAPSDQVLITAIGALSTAYAAENTTYYTALAQSTNQSVVLDALVHLSNINNNPNLTPDEKIAAINYLKAMAAALAFMAKIRATVSQLDAELRQEETQGKLSTISDQTAAAKQAYKSGLEKLKNQLESVMHALAMQAMMKWLGPIIIILLMIIVILLMCIPGGALLAPLVIGIMVAFIVAMSVVVIIDMETGCFKKLGKAMGIPDGPGQDAISFAVQAIILALMVVFTLGLASPAVAAMVAAEGVEVAAEVSAEVIEQAVSQVTKQLVTQVMKKTLNMAIQQGISVLFSSGLVTDAYTAIAKAAGMKDEDASTFSMVMTTITMVVSMFAAYKACAGLMEEEAAATVKSMLNSAMEEAETAATKTASSVARSAGSVEEDAEVNLEGELDDAASDADDVHVQVDATPSGGAAPEADTAAFISLMKRLSKKLAEMMKPDTSAAGLISSLLKLLETGTQTGAAVLQGINELTQSNLSKSQASMEVANAHADAMMQELNQLVQGYEFTQKDLDSTSSDFLKMYNNLIQLFGNMVSSASSIVSKTTQIGS